MRKYQPVWERLKKLGSCTLEVPPSFVARVKKAIIREKHRDLGFKTINDDDVYRLTISYDISTKRLRFDLKARFGLEERKAG